MSDSINLQLKDCNCEGPHEVKLGGNYNGQRRWSKKHLKGAVPAPLVRSIARQLIKQWGLKIPVMRPSLTHGARIGRAFIKVLPDTGATKAHCTSDTLEAILELNKSQHPSPITIQAVPEYMVELADGTTVTGNAEAVADVHLITPSGSALLPKVSFNVVPGKLAPLIVGRLELEKLGMQPIWKLIERQIIHNNRQRPIMAKSADSVVLEEWRKRRKLQSEGEPETLIGIDEMYGLGAPEPTKTDLSKALDGILERAKSAGAPKAYMAFLTDLILNRYRHLFQLQLGKSPPCFMQPLVIVFDEKTFPVRGVVPRRYGPEQLRFLAKKVPLLCKAGILRPSHTRFAAPVYLPFKGDGVSLRMCLDNRLLNKSITPSRWPLPDMKRMVQSVRGAKYFATLDACQGYFQAPLLPCSYKYSGMITPDATYEFTRVTMGMRNSAGWYAYMMTRILDGSMDPVIHLDNQREFYNKLPAELRDAHRPNLLKTTGGSGVLQYLDDTLIFSDSIQGLQDIVLKYCRRLWLFNVYVNPKKCKFWSTCVSWLGWQIQASGVSISPDRHSALLAIPVPINAAELQSYLCSLQWVKSKLVNFNTTIAPLQKILNLALQGTSRTSKVAGKIQLQKFGFGKEHVDSFNATKTMLKNAIEMAHYDENKHLCLFTDASEFHYGCVLTQVSQSDRSKPLAEQDHECLELMSGSFNTPAEKNWHISCKEAWAIVHFTRVCRHWLARPRTFSVFSDHQNLIHIFSNKMSRVSKSKSTMDRLARWGWELDALPYKLIIIPGVQNVVADMMSRWGSGHRPPPKTEARICVAHVPIPSPTPPRSQAKHLAHASPTSIFTRKDQAARVKYTLPSTIYEMPHPWQWPNKEDMHKSQRSLSKKELVGAQRKAGLWYRDDRILIPVSDIELQSRICVISHAGSAGHRGQKATYNAVKARFYWPGLPDVVRTFVWRCLQCQKTASGKCRPLVFGQQIVAERPGQVVHIDHLYIQRDSESGDMYLLVLKCGFSHMCELRATKSVDVVTTVRTILDWISRYGIMEYIVSDGPSSFKNSLMKTLADTLRLTHHITLSYTPWSNGGVERLMREILKVFRAILSELGPRWTFHRWPELVPQLQYVLNSTDNVSLGCSPIEACTGQKPRSVADLLAFTGNTFKEVETTNIPTSTIRKHVDTIRKVFKEMSTYTRRFKNKAHARANKHRKPLEEARLHIGDFVLLSRKRTRQSKLQCNWLGPYVTVEPITDYIWKLKTLDGSETVEAHVQRIKRYSDASLKVTSQLIEHARGEDNHVLDKFVNWRVDPDGMKVELLCQWRGFPPEWNTYESVEHHLWSFKPLRNDILTYLRSAQGMHYALDDTLARLESQARSSSKNKQVTRKTNRRGVRGKKGGTRIKTRPAIYQQPSGGWVVQALGAVRRFSSRKRAEKALQKHTYGSRAKACITEGLGGSVESRHNSTHKGTMHQPSYKTFKQSHSGHYHHKHSHPGHTQHKHGRNHTKRHSQKAQASHRHRAQQQAQGWQATASHTPGRQDNNKKHMEARASSKPRSRHHHKQAKGRKASGSGRKPGGRKTSGSGRKPGGKKPGHQARRT